MGSCFSREPSYKTDEKKLQKLLQRIRVQWTKSKRIKSSNGEGFLNHMQNRLSMLNIKYRHELKSKKNQNSEDFIETLFKTIIQVDNLPEFVNWATNDPNTSKRLIQKLRKLLKSPQTRVAILNLMEIAIVWQTFHAESLESVFHSFSTFPKTEKNHEEAHDLMKIFSKISQHFFDRFSLAVSQIDEAFVEMDKLCIDFCNNMKAILSGPGKNFGLFDELDGGVRIMIVAFVVFVGAWLIKSNRKSIDSFCNQGSFTAKRKRMNLKINDSIFRY